MAVRADAYAHVEFSCEECGYSWREDMTELATGYDHCYGMDDEECPECEDEE